MDDRNWGLGFMSNHYEYLNLNSCQFNFFNENYDIQVKWILILFELISYFCDNVWLVSMKLLGLIVGKTKYFFSHMNEQNDYPKYVQ